MNYPHDSMFYLGVEIREWIGKRMSKLRLRVPKPEYSTMKGWKEWEDNARAEQPLAFWLNETVPEWLRDVKSSITSPLNNARYWIRMRVFDRYHIINTRLKPGYSDADTRMLYGMFNLLVDFIEVDKAWMHVVFDNAERAKRKHPWWSRGWTRFKSYRDPDAGLAHLAWEMTLGDPDLPIEQRADTQARDAREQLELYKWWKEIRPARPDPHDASGWTALCDARTAKGRSFFDDDDETPEDESETRRILDECQRIEREYDEEDEAMLIRLVKIRKGMWT